MTGTDDQQRLCSFVSAHPELLAALYDLDLTPEQTIGTPDWSKTVRVVALYEQLWSRLRRIEEAWSESWDCSADPGHGLMSRAMLP